MTRHRNIGYRITHNLKVDGTGANQKAASAKVGFDLRNRRNSEQSGCKPDTFARPPFQRERLDSLISRLVTEVGRQASQGLFTSRSGFKVYFSCSWISYDLAIKREHRNGKSPACG